LNTLDRTDFIIKRELLIHGHDASLVYTIRHFFI
jgi:hypothetical protein